MSVELHNLRVMAVDGGTATGKGRLIDELAAIMRLKGIPVIHVSTGSLYRAVALAAIDAASEQVPARADMDAATLSHAALEYVREMSAEKLLELAHARTIEMHGGEVWMDGAPVHVDDQLKGPAVGTGASIVARVIPVREFEKDITRRQVNEFDGFVLIDGRAIAHETVPEAPLKLMLSVSPEVAATRSREHSLEEIVARDERDRNRPVGALRHPDNPGDGVRVVATDHHTPESLRDEVYEMLRETFPELLEIRPEA